MPSITSAPPRSDWASWVATSNDVTGQFLAAAGQPGFISLAGGLPAAELYPVEAVARRDDSSAGALGTGRAGVRPGRGLPGAACRDRRAHLRRDRRHLPRGARAADHRRDAGARPAGQGCWSIRAISSWPSSRPISARSMRGGPGCPRYEHLRWDPDDPNPDASAARPPSSCTRVPNFSNPTGVLVPQEQRTALLERVTRAGTWLVEDDPYLALQLDGPVPAGLLTLDVAARGAGPYDGRVVYLGTLSKSIAPGLRVGWVVAEPEMIRMLALAKQCSDLSSSMFTHAVALELLEAHVEDAHVPRILACYRERRDALHALATRRARRVVRDGPAVGRHVPVAAGPRSRVRHGCAVPRALAEGVAFVPSSVFDPTGALNTAMRVNFTRNGPDAMTEGVRRLARAVRGYLAEDGSSRDADLPWPARRATTARRAGRSMACACPARSPRTSCRAAATPTRPSARCGRSMGRRASWASRSRPGASRATTGRCTTRSRPRRHATSSWSRPADGGTSRSSASCWAAPRGARASRASSSMAASGTWPRSAAGRTSTCSAAGSRHAARRPWSVAASTSRSCSVGVAVAPGDLVIGDDDGLVFVPHGLTESLLPACLARVEAEAGWQATLDTGATTIETFGVPAAVPRPQAPG